MSGHLDGPPPGPPDPPYIPGDLGAPSAEEFARRRASSEPRPENPTPEERVRDGSHLPGGYRTLYVPTSVALRAVADARDDERRRIRGLVANRAADLLVTDSPLGSALASPTFENVAVVRLADAEAAVLAAVDARTAEIVDALLGEQWGIAREGEVGRFAADLIARRFPNEGTNAPPVSGGDEGNTP